MIKIIIYSIITIAIIHFVLYYFNFDFNDIKFGIFKNKSNIDDSINISHSLIYDSINELKTLNECINNGQIDTSFS